MKKVSKKYLALKYKDKAEVDKEDVRLLLELYENKIKRLKFLLNTYKKKQKKSNTIAGSRDIASRTMPNSLSGFIEKF